MSNVIVDSVGALGNVQTVVEIVSGCYKAFRVKRLESFAKDCQKLLFQDELFEEGKFQDYFQEPFAQEHIHQFFHSILETHSRISQLAIAKLFTDAIVRKTKFLTFKESVILKALQGLEDIEIEVLFLCFEVGYKVSENAVDINTFKTDKAKFIFQFGNTDFEKNRHRFEELGIVSKNQIRSIVQRFFYSKIFTEKVNVIVNRYSDVWLSEGEDVAKNFLSLLEWAREIENS